MKSYWVYMLRCADDSYYIGVTNDADRRVAEHNAGVDLHCYTFMRRPVSLVHASEFHEIDDAIRWEKQIKKWSRRKKEALIRGDWEEIKRLARS